MINEKVFLPEEKIIYNLRALYESFGYKQYKIKKFEEYDLYANNKDFLVSNKVITFTDTDGKLLALKPDVTLSIVKNTIANGTTEKLYYNENVYRVEKRTDSFKEIMQAGLEVIGEVDEYQIYETLLLACKSLQTVSNDFILNISDLGIVSGITGASNLTEKGKNDIFDAIKAKNFQLVKQVLDAENVSGKVKEAILLLVKTYGDYKVIEENIDALSVTEEVNKKLTALINLAKSLEDGELSGKIKIDFSVLSDTNYYNGIVFNGVIYGTNGYALSGGEYDNLLKKMGKNSRAIGFAVYLDVLSKANMQSKKYQVDTVVLYDDKVSLNELTNKVNSLINNGEKVLAVKNIPETLTYKTIIDLKGGN